MRHLHPSSSSAYSPSAYDEDMCLKPSPLLWLAMLYLSRAVMLPVLIGVGHIAGVDAAAMTMLREYWSADQLIPAAFALPVLYAAIRRVPSASKPVRTIWSHGRTLLAIAAALDIGLPLTKSLIYGDFGEQLVGALALAAVGGYFLAYILSANRVRDTFRDFPPPHGLPPYDRDSL